MSNTVHVVKIYRPDEGQMSKLYSLMHAAEAAEDRFSSETGTDVLEQASFGHLSDEQRAFFATAWDVLVNDGGFGRLMAAYSTFDNSFQNPAVDYVEAAPELQELAHDAELLPIVLEAYEQAKREITYLTSACDLAEEILHKARNGEHHEDR